MTGRFRPHRSLRSELVSLAFVAVASIAMVSVFPMSALRPLPSAPMQGAGASCAFVTLTPAEERQAIAAARAAWQISRGPLRNSRIDIFADALPAFPWRAAIDTLPRMSTGNCLPAPYVPDPLPPTLAAPPPVTIAPQPNADPPTFSREELLKLK